MLVLHVVVMQLAALQEIVVLGDGEAVGQCSPKGAGQGPRGGVHASPQLVRSRGQHWVFIYSRGEKVVNCLLTNIPSWLPWRKGVLRGYPWMIH